MASEAEPTNRKFTHIITDDVEVHFDESLGDYLHRMFPNDAPRMYPAEMIAITSALSEYWHKTQRIREYGKFLGFERVSCCVDLEATKDSIFNRAILLFISLTERR